MRFEILLLMYAFAGSSFKTREYNSLSMQEKLLINEFSFKFLKIDKFKRSW